MTDFVQPDYTVDSGTAYPLNIDQASAALSQRPLFNRILNGDWMIDQINEGALYTVNGGAIRTVDGWSGDAVGAGVFKVRRVADPDFASQNALEITCTTADASIAAGDLYTIWHAIEGYDVADLRSGLATAAKITISFDMKFSVTGVYGVSLRNNAGTRAYVGTVTQNSANVRESKTVTLTLDTTGTWLYTNGKGLEVAFCLAAGSSWQGTAGAWGGSTIFTTSSQVNFMSSTSNIGYIGPIRLVPGLWPASLYRAESIGDALRRCQRYYAKSFRQGVAPQQNLGLTSGETRVFSTKTGAVSFPIRIELPVPMRTHSLSVTTYNPEAANAQVRNQDDAADFTATSAVVDSNHSFYITSTGNAGLAVGEAVGVHWAANARLS